jgi:hypothetical protein
MMRTIFSKELFMTDAQYEKVKKYLVKGGDFTLGQAKSKFGIRSMKPVISAMRLDGYAVYENPRTTRTGKKITLFRVGTPPRRVVSAGFQSLGMV